MELRYDTREKRLKTLSTQRNIITFKPVDENKREQIIIEKYEHNSKLGWVRIYWTEHYINKKNVKRSAVYDNIEQLESYIDWDWMEKNVSRDDEFIKGVD
jgi:hypothetical protein